MLYKNDWEKAEQKFIEFWQRENHDRPLISVVAPREGYVKKEIKTPASLIDRWMDIDYIIESSRESFSSTYFGGEAYPNLCPNLGPDIFGAFMGCELDFGEDTSWSKQLIHNWDETKGLSFDQSNKWWKKMKELTESVVNDSKGDYIVGITDIHSGADGLVSLRGPENLCLDIYDNPDRIKKANFEMFEIYKQVIDYLYSICLKNQKGSSNWMGIWHPEKWYVTSSDFICMISQENFSEFILPELTQEIEFLDASMFHLDGPGALKHLDALLQIPKLKGIQWVYGAGQPTASHWIPVLKKIQDAGKLIQVEVLPEELDILLEEIEPQGVMYKIWCDSEEDAKALLSKAGKSYKNKLY